MRWQDAPVIEEVPPAVTPKMRWQDAPLVEDVAAPAIQPPSAVGPPVGMVTQPGDPAPGAGMRPIPMEAGAAVDTNPAATNYMVNGQLPGAPPHQPKVDLTQPVPGLAVGQPFNVEEAVAAQPGLPQADPNKPAAQPWEYPSTAEKLWHGGVYGVRMAVSDVANAAHFAAQQVGLRGLSVSGYETRAELELMKSLRIPGADKLTEDQPDKVSALLEEYAPGYAEKIGGKAKFVGFIGTMMATGGAGGAGGTIPSLGGPAVKSAAGAALKAYAQRAVPTAIRAGLLTGTSRLGAGASTDDAIKEAAHNAGLMLVASGIPGGATPNQWATNTLTRAVAAGTYGGVATYAQTKDIDQSMAVAGEYVETFLIFDLAFAAGSQGFASFKARFAKEPKIKNAYADAMKSLDLPEDATYEQVRSRFRQYVKGEHPDVAPKGAAAQTEFGRKVEMYREVLRNLAPEAQADITGQPVAAQPAQPSAAPSKPPPAGAGAIIPAPTAVEPPAAPIAPQAPVAAVPASVAAKAPIVPKAETPAPDRMLNWTPRYSSPRRWVRLSTPPASSRRRARIAGPR